MSVLPCVKFVRSSYLLTCIVCFCFLPTIADAQKRRAAPIAPAKKQIAKRAAPIAAIVIDERLAVLRFEPSLAAIPVQRMQTGRNLLILSEKETEGIKFYRVQLPPEKTGWVQSEAVASNSKAGDDERLARLIRASDGFEQVERAAIFLENFPASRFRPAVLLLLGDLLEDWATRLTRDATRRLDEAEMRASGAPAHSYFLNYSGLDRFRRVGANFVFDRERKQFHHDGATWREITQKHPKSAEASEAAKRLASLNALNQK